MTFVLAGELSASLRSQLLHLKEMVQRDYIKKKGKSRRLNNEKNIIEMGYIERYVGKRVKKGIQFLMGITNKDTKSMRICAIRARTISSELEVDLVKFCFDV